MSQIEGITPESKIKSSNCDSKAVPAGNEFPLIVPRSARHEDA